MLFFAYQSGSRLDVLVPVSSIVNFLHVHIGIANPISGTDARRLTHILSFAIYLAALNLVSS
jgi:hypothetical protein